MTTERRATIARWARPGAFAASGLVAGGLLAGSLTAYAAQSGYAATAPSSDADPSRPQRSDEDLLTGTTASKVKAADLTKYPGAAVARIESDSDGVYGAHLTTSGGPPVTVEVDKSFAVTGTEQGGHGGG